MSTPTDDDRRLTADPWRQITRLSRLQFGLILAVLLAFWTTTVIVVLATFWMHAWDDRHEARAAAPTAAVTAAQTAAHTATPVDGRPAAVPPTAQTVQHNIVLGDVADGLHFFERMSCEDGITTIVTSKETVYAEIPCDRMLPGTTLARLRGQIVRIRIVDGALIMESLFVASFRFDVGRVWLETR